MQHLGARAAVSGLIALLVLPCLPAAADDARTYERPINTVWDHAVKAIRDVGFVLIDSNRAEHELTMRTRSKLSHKRGLVMEVTLTGDHTVATIHVRAADPEKVEKTAKHIRRYLDALDKRLD